MADQIEKKVVLDITAPGAAVTVKDLKDNIKLLKEQLDKAKIGTEDYQKTLSELKLNQNALKDANYATSSSFETVAQAATGTGESYNALVHRMAAYKEEARAVDQSTVEGVARFNELAQQINVTNDKLKAMDEKMGNHQRNVGNYKSALDGFAGGMRMLGGSATGVIAPIQGVTMGLKAMSATPVVAILGVLVTIITKVISEMKKSEAATHAMRKAMASFEPILNIMTKGVEVLAIGLSKVVEWAGKVISRLFGVKEASEAAIERTREEIELEKGLREQSKEEARLEAEVADLRLKAADKQKYSAQERAKYLAEAEKKEIEFAEKAYKMADKQVDLTERALAATVSGTEDYEKATQAAVAAYQERAKWAGKLLQIKQAENKVTKEMNRQDAADLKESEETLKQIIKEAEDAADAMDKIAAADLAKLDRDIEEANKKLAKYESIRLQNIEDATARRQQDAEMEIEEARALEDRKFEIQQDGLTRRAELLRQFYADALGRGDVELALEYEQQAQDLEYQIEYEGYMRRKELRERDAKERKAVLEGMVGATTSILGAIADAYEATGDMSEAEAERVKGLRIAGTIIETISGAVSAYMGTIKSMAGSPLAIPMAVANSATVLTAGYAQIAKMRNTDSTGKSAPVSESRMQSAAVNAPAPVQMVPVTRSLTSASEEARLNEAQRVVIVDSDIKAAGRRAEVVDNETDLG